MVALALRLHSRWGRLARQATEHCRQMSAMAMTLLVAGGLPSPLAQVGLTGRVAQIGLTCRVAQVGLTCRVAQVGLTCRVAQAGPASDSALPAAAAPEPPTWLSAVLS